MKNLCFFPSDKIKRFVMFEKKMPKKKYLLMIFKTDREDLPGMHWWSILNVFSTSKLLFLDSFGIAWLNNFVLKDNKKAVNKVLNGIEKLLLSEKNRDFFHLLERFGKYKNITKSLKV